MSRPVIAVVAAGAVALLAGCGVRTEDAGRDARTSTSAESPRTSGSTTRQPERGLPQRPDGTVALASQANAFTDGLVARLGASSRGVRVVSTRSSEGSAYDALCTGRSDVVQTSIAPTSADDRACASRGLEIADPVQLGSDAVVLATRNASDVGGDCLSVRQARDIFRDGSPYDNWRQLGFDDLPLRVAGREDGSSTFEFFGLEVLGVANPSLDNVRSDFRVRTSDQDERRLITGAAGLRQAQTRADRYAARQRSRTRTARRTAVGRAVRRADRSIKREVAAIDARNRRLDLDVGAARRSRDNARRAARAKRSAAVQANLRFDADLNRKIARYRAAQVDRATRNGYVGHFSFRYYELFEAELRPLEIDFGTPQTGSGRPVRFGDLTPADQARLAPIIRRERGDSAGGAAATLPDVDGLPEETADGQAILRGPNCVFPSRVTITTGSYPLTRRIFYVTTAQALRRPEVRRFLLFALETAQRQASGAQVVPITEQQRRDAHETITGAPPPDQPDAVDARTPVAGTSGATGSSGRLGTAATGTTGGG